MISFARDGLPLVMTCSVRRRIGRAEVRVDPDRLAAGEESARQLTGLREVLAGPA